MIRIHTLFTGQPHTYTDEHGTWTTAIFRTPVSGPVALGPRGLAGDQVADTKNHGRPTQAVCCHPLAHYAAWNAEYGLTDPAQQVGPGSVGENWTLSDMTEADVCIGDIYQVGTARVEVTGPRYPCTKQERKLGLPGWHRRTMETQRTGFYLRVLTPGTVQAGNEWILEARPNVEITVARINQSEFGTFDPAFARQVVAAPQVAPFWRDHFQKKLAKAAA